jgi:CheY-like chemotaxis protein
MNPTPSYRALVVDDEPSVRQLLTRILSGAGFLCELATDGRDALDMARINQYDIVITDLKMPDIHGHALAVQLMDMARRPAIIVVTGISEPRIADDLRSRGVEDILFKPVDPELLTSRAKTIAQERLKRLRNSYQPRAVGVGISNDEEYEDQFGSLPEEDVDSVDEFTSVGADAQGDCATPLSEDPAISSKIEIDTPSKDRSEKKPSQQSSTPDKREPIAARVAQIAETLPNPPQKYDGYSSLSNNSFSAQDLIKAIQADPRMAFEVLQMSNRAMYSSHLALTDFELGVSTTKKHFLLWLCFAFGMGVLWGWLFGWLQASYWIIDETIR